MAGAGGARDRGRPVPGGVVARRSGCGCRRSVAPSGSACSSCWRPRPLCRSCWLRLPTRTDGAAAARPQVRPAASAGHHDRRRARGRRPTTSSRWRSGAPISSARCGPPRRSRPGCRRRASRRAIRSRCAALVLVLRDRDLRGRRRRAPAAHRRGLRLAGRDAAGQFPHRRLGEPADLYRQAAGDPAGPAAGRAGAAARRRPLSVPAGSTLVIRASGAGPARRRHDRRRAAEAPTDRRARPQAAAKGTEERRFIINDAGSATVRGVGGERRDLAVHRHPGPAADDRARQGSGGAGARRPAALLQARGRLRRRRRAGDLQARRTAAPTASRRARSSRRPISRWCCRRRAPGTASARPPRT